MNICIAIVWLFTYCSYPLWTCDLGIKMLYSTRSVCVLYKTIEYQASVVQYIRSCKIQASSKTQGHKHLALKLPSWISENYKNVHWINCCFVIRLKWKKNQKIPIKFHAHRSNVLLVGYCTCIFFVHEQSSFFLIHIYMNHNLA